MFRANIYSLEVLDKLARENIHTGIEMVAAYMGESVVAKEFRLKKVSTDSHGRVNPARIGFGSLDKMVELHLMAVPLIPDQHAARLGLAGAGRGWAYVDTAAKMENPQAGLRLVTAHETAHAFGFVRHESTHNLAHDSAHCADPDCIMHSQSTPKVIIDQKHPGETRMTSLKRSARHMLDLLTAEPIIGYQYDFCLDCKVDLRQHAASNINQLRINRTIRNQPI